ncbi:AEC family transporter [Loktanella sp. S4079]|uniref:AEC family transporter n=1 Tax=Loktanella sp. S4079 TaxID=579483 RepID=UPI0005FA003E|nr:AEC family transporter [Loktanella sp. S4079]KJZ18510.1 hypothetical protein TW80_13845 [Loktanella sp. S4079]
MFDVITITGTIFIVIGVGFAAVRTGAFSTSDMGTLGKFVVNFALPALILRAVSSQPIHDIANVGYLGAVLVGSLAVFWFGYFWSRQISKESPSASTFSAMGMSCANTGFVGFPILLIALPEVASQALALNMIVENLVMIPLVLIMAERAQGQGISGGKLAKQIATRLLRNPIVIALILGLGISALGLRLPTVFVRPIDMFASASAALSLTVIGGTLASLQINEIKWPVLRITLGKLLLHPLAVALSLLGMSLIGFDVGDDRLFAAAIIMAATPVMAIYPILAQRYGEERNASLAMFTMTAASFVTLSITLSIVWG